MSGASGLNVLRSQDRRRVPHVTCSRRGRIPHPALAAPHQTAHIVMTIWTRMTVTSVRGRPASASSGPGIDRKNSEILARLKPTTTASSVRLPRKIHQHTRPYASSTRNASGASRPYRNVPYFGASRDTVPARCRHCGSGDRAGDATALRSPGSRRVAHDQRALPSTTRVTPLQVPSAPSASRAYTRDGCRRRTARSARLSCARRPA